MLIIGHRGAKALAQENTIASLRAGLAADADILEFDVRITRDGIPVLAHGIRALNTRRRDLTFIRRYTLEELKKHDPSIAPLEKVMKQFFGKVLLNIEIKEYMAVKPVMAVVEPYIKKKADWDMVLISSFKPFVLRAVRKRANAAPLSLVHYRNPLTFVAWHRVLNLEAVGFHRLYVNDIALSVAKRFGLFTYAYTVNRPKAARRLESMGIDGIVTDDPAMLAKALS